MTTLTNQYVASCFDIAAKEYDESSNPYTVQRRVNALIPYVQGSSIEIGGGTGVVTAALPDPSRVLHSDIAPGMCRVAQHKIGCPSVCCDAERLPLAERSVDTAIASEVIYYLEHPKRLIDEAFRVLRPHGVLLLSATNPLATPAVWIRSLCRRLGLRGMFIDDGSPRFLSLGHLNNRLKKSGFVIEQKGKIVLLPFSSCDKLNRFLEQTILRHLGIFMIIVARKPGDV